jgi:hypothetical protein
MLVDDDRDRSPAEHNRSSSSSGRRAFHTSSSDEEESEEVHLRVHSFDNSPAVERDVPTSSSVALGRVSEIVPDESACVAVETVPLPAVVMSEGLSRTQQDWLATTCERGWTRPLRSGEVLTNTSLGGGVLSYHVLVVSAVGVRDGWAVAARTLLYLKV